MQTYLTPGVYPEEIYPVPPHELRTGVPAFLGLVKEKAEQALYEHVSLRASTMEGVSFLGRKDVDARAAVPERFTHWPQFKQTFDELRSTSYVGHAVRGFFENGGRMCYVQMITFKAGTSIAGALGEGLKTLERLDVIDLVCAPDIMWPHRQRASSSQAREELLPEDEILRMQAAVLKHCTRRGDRLAILDPLPGARVDEVKGVPEKVRQTAGVKGMDGALYYPWVLVRDGPVSSGGFVPPCGHVAGVFARTDERAGVHKAPANEILEGVLDLEIDLSNDQQGELNPVGVNCLRSFPGRGIRIWGARTLSSEKAWLYVNVRRLFLTAARWIERNMADIVFEPHSPQLWARVKRELTAYFTELLRQGAFHGSTPEEAFYIKCDEETNPLPVREQGQVVVEIGLAPAVPNEFIVVRLIHGVSGVSITGPMQPG
jgi:phage tail sheath protein FI